MEDNNQFKEQLEVAINKKQEWFNSEALVEVLNQYRVLSSCVRNLYDLLKKRSLLNPDPYGADKQITDIIIPDTEPFLDNEIPNILGIRLSDYYSVLDYLSNYFRFSVDNLSAAKIKKLLEFNNFIDWSNVSPSSTKLNTHALAVQLTNAKVNAPALVSGMISDCVSKSAEAVETINKTLQELSVFQKERYKLELRHNLFSHPDFNHQIAFSTPDAEFSEIKRIYPKVMGKKPFYKDLVNEIIMEDQSSDKEKLRESILKKLEISFYHTKKTNSKIKESNTKQMILSTVMAIGGMASILEQLRVKLSDNFNIYYSNKVSFSKKIAELLKKLFHIPPAEKICTIKIVEAKTGIIREQKVNVNNFLAEIGQKARVYNGIANQGMEFQKLTKYPEEMIFNFVTKQIAECQTLFSTINGLDSFFKTEVDTLNRPKIKGVQIELSALRNAILSAQKKRSEYQSTKEEKEQLSNLGIK